MGNCGCDAWVIAVVAALMSLVLELEQLVVEEQVCVRGLGRQLICSAVWLAFFQ